MSAPLNLTAEQLRKIGAALDTLTDITRTTGVDFTSAGLLQVELGGSALRVSWDGSAYVIDDRNGD